MNRKIFLILLLMVFAANAVAEKRWQIDTEKSRLFFIFNQAGSDEQGEFKQFLTELVFDSDDLSNSRLKVKVIMASLQTGDRDRDEILFSEDMFNQKRWPAAFFESNHIRKLGGNEYLAKAQLTIRDKTKEIDFPFKIDIENGSGLDKLRLQSHLTINRLQFGVGQGDWADDKWIANPVQVKVDLYAIQIGDNNEEEK